MASQLSMPYELSIYIHNFIRPNVYRKKMSSVIRQIDYHKKEFYYKSKICTNPFTLWGGASEFEYHKYALREAYLKKNVDKPYTRYTYYYNNR